MMAIAQCEQKTRRYAKITVDLLKIVMTGGSNWLNPLLVFQIDPDHFRLLGKSANPMKGLVSPSTPGWRTIKPPFSKACPKNPWCPSRLSPSPAALLRALPAAPCAPRCSLSRKSSLPCCFKGWLQGTINTMDFGGINEHHWYSLIIFIWHQWLICIHMPQNSSSHLLSSDLGIHWPFGPCSLCVWQCHPRPQLAAVVHGAFLLQHFGGLCLCCLWGDRPGALRTRRNEVAKRWIRWDQHNKH